MTITTLILRAALRAGLPILALAALGLGSPAHATGKVCFYKKVNYKGKQWCVDYNENGAPQFGSKVRGDLVAKANEVGSIKITGSGFPGMWIYDKEYDGKSLLLTRSRSDLGSMNNEMSSWVIRNKGRSNTKVRLYVRKVFYDGRDPDGASRADHLLYTRVWQGNTIRWNALIASSANSLTSNGAWTGRKDNVNYKKDTNHWLPAVVKDWTDELGHHKQVTFAAWDCAGRCYVARTPDGWADKPPCADRRCSQGGQGTTYPLGDLVLDLTRYRVGQTVTLTEGPMTIEVEIWKNPYFGQSATSQRSPDQISLVGSTTSYTQDGFRDYVAGLKFTGQPDTEPAYSLVGGAGVQSLVPGQCTVVYPNANAGGNKANVDIGSLTCAVELADGVTVSVTPVYGGCNIQSGGGGRQAECSIGVFTTTLRVEHSIPGCGAQICNFSEELTYNGPNASACDTVTYDSYCQQAGAELVSAEVKVTDGNGNGVGAGVSVGVGAGAGVTVDDGVFSASVELKVLAGAEISFSIGYEEDAKALYRLGERGVMYMNNNAQAMGKRYADVFYTPGVKRTVKAFAGIAKIRRAGSTIRFAKDVGNAIANFSTGFTQGSWQSASNFFNSATSWIPKWP